MYAAPAHIGTLRVATSFENVHAIVHAPIGDDYFNIMRSMLWRERDFTPVTTSVVDRHVLSRERGFTPVTTSVVDRHVLSRGSQEKVVDNITRNDAEEYPDSIVLTTR